MAEMNRTIDAWHVDTFLQINLPHGRERTRDAQSLPRNEARSRKYALEIHLVQCQAFPMLSAAHGDHRRTSDQPGGYTT